MNAENMITHQHDILVDLEPSAEMAISDRDAAIAHLRERENNVARLQSDILDARGELCLLREEICVLRTTSATAESVNQAATSSATCPVHAGAESECFVRPTHPCDKDGNT